MIIAGTGHRPDKLGGYSPEVFNRLVLLAEDWLEGIEDEIKGVISGGALGWDQALARAALSLELPLTMALPFPGFEDRWPLESKLSFYSITAGAKKIHFVNDGPYAVWKMQARNEWMVDHCNHILALWNGTRGGTANCLNYARRKGTLITNLWPSYEAMLNHDSRGASLLVSDSSGS